MRNLFCLILLSSLSQAAAGRAQTDGPVVVLGHGVMCDVTIAGRRTAPETESGVINLIDEGRRFDVITGTVPAIRGLSFGIRATLDDQPALDVRIVVTHPPMGPRGITRQSWAAQMREGAASLGLFSFEHAYELVQGDWTFRIVRDGETLARQDFTVLSDIAVPAVQKVCFGDRFTS